MKIRIYRNGKELSRAEIIKESIYLDPANDLKAVSIQGRKWRAAELNNQNVVGAIDVDETSSVELPPPDPDVAQYL